ncbi:MAG: hypothetical protein AAF320_00445 [Myxococcota bacterium]
MRARLRYSWILATLCGIALLKMSDAARVTWIYNATPSVPTGWYRVDYARPIVLGELVAWRPSVSQDHWMQQRGYIAKGVFLIKQVVAAAPQQVCWQPEGNITEPTTGS